MQKTLIQDLMAMLDASPVNFLAVEYVENRLKEAGFEALDMALPLPELQAGKTYFIKKNGSALMGLIMQSGSICRKSLARDTEHFGGSRADIASAKEAVLRRNQRQPRCGIS